jgi:hypothetical protein
MNKQISELENKLFNKMPSEMLESEVDILVKQYKLYVEMMDKVSERRHQANSFFLTVNTILLTALTGFVSLSKEFSASYIWIVVPTLAGVIFCLSWHRLIRSYGQLNSGKFKIIHLLETCLPARLFYAEWDALGQGESSVYKPFTRTESWVPFVFGGLYIVLGILAILGL